MKIKLGNGLLLINILAIILILAISFIPTSFIRIILGIPFVLFFPGYVLMVALYPRKSSLDGIAFSALSLGLSIAVAVLLGLILNYTAVGIRLESILYSLFAFIIILSITGWLRLRGLRPDERREIGFRLTLPYLGKSRLDKTLAIILILVVLGTLGTVGYVLVKPKTGDNFTQFYLLGSEGKAEGYIKELQAGEVGEVLVGIINNEHQTATYRIEVTVDGIKNNEVNEISLRQGEKWESEVTFTSRLVAEKCKVEFFLYKNGESVPLFEPLRLWVNVFS